MGVLSLAGQAFIRSPFLATAGARHLADPSPLLALILLLEIVYLASVTVAVPRNTNAIAVEKCNEMLCNIDIAKLGSRGCMYCIIQS